MSNILLISAPSAGKGVIAKYLREKYNLVHMSIGNLLREKSLNDEPLKKILAEGNFANNEIVYNLFEKFLEENSGANFVFDGFPRLIEQIKSFESILNKYNISLDKVIYINTDKDIAKKRILGRLICKNCNEIYGKYLDNLDDLKCKKCGENLYPRDDDKLSTYENRYELFIQNTIPVIEYFKNRYDFYEVSNNGDINDTYNQIDEIMKGNDENDNN
ncbi:MAG: nucleoside monophosphate kinase [Bacilli bacterium]|nr:nucleoside monophosphate kinase [Bacilli bacterium]